MEHTIYDSKSGPTYGRNGDYCLLAGEDNPKENSIGPWGQRHLAFLKKRQRVVYRELQMNGRLNSYLAEIDTQATEMFDRLMKQLSKAEGVTEDLKAENQMLWVQMMNNLRNAATEIVLSELIYCQVADTKVKLEHYEIRTLINRLYQQRCYYVPQPNSEIGDILLQLVRKSENMKPFRRRTLLFELCEVRFDCMCLIER